MRSTKQALDKSSKRLKTVKLQLTPEEYKTIILAKFIMEKDKKTTISHFILTSAIHQAALLIEHAKKTAGLGDKAND